MDDIDWADSMDCHHVGISGGCGYECPVLLRGECETEDEMLASANVPDLETFIEIGEQPSEQSEPVDKYRNFDRAMEGI